MNVYIGRRDDYSAMRGPCPKGFHIPSKEWWDSIIQILTSTFGMEINGPTLGTYLKMPMAGFRSRFTSEVDGVGTSGDYWSCTPGSSSPLFGWEFGFVTETSTILPMKQFGRAFGYSLRGFKDSPVVPTSSWTTLYDGSSVASGAGIFRSSAEGLISISGNGLVRYTMQDKNLGATTVYNQGNTLTDANCGKFYQWGNNYGFSHSGTVTTSSTQVDASGYGPENYYNSSTFIMDNNDWSSVQNDDLWGYVTGIQVTGHPIKNAYIGEVGEYTISNIPTTDTNVYTNVGRSGKTIQSVKFNFIATSDGAYVHISGDNSNSNRYGVCCGRNTSNVAADLCAIRGRLNGASDTYYRTVSYSRSGTNQIEFYINRDGSCYITVNGTKTTYTAGTAELNIIQTIMNLSNMNVYASQNQSCLTGNKIDVEVTYS